VKKLVKGSAWSRQRPPFCPPGILYMRTCSLTIPRRAGLARIVKVGSPGWAFNTFYLLFGGVTPSFFSPGSAGGCRARNLFPPNSRGCLLLGSQHGAVVEDEQSVHVADFTLPLLLCQMEKSWSADSKSVNSVTVISNSAVSQKVNKQILRIWPRIRGKKDKWQKWQKLKKWQKIGVRNQKSVNQQTANQ
jgi:hypothetical protein